MAEYRYAVEPLARIFDTRHDAAGFAAVHGREYTYHDLNPPASEVPVRVTPFEVTA